jgi:hypothetical protein
MLAAITEMLPTTHIMNKSYNSMESASSKNCIKIFNYLKRMKELDLLLVFSSLGHFSSTKLSISKETLS